MVQYRFIKCVGFLFIKVTDEWREKQSKAQSKVPIDILDLDMNVIASFRNSKDAGKFLNVTSKTIRMAKSHKYKVRKLYYIVNSNVVNG